MEQMLQDFLKKNVRGIVITDANGEIISTDGEVSLSDPLRRQLAKRAGDAITGKRSASKWEFINPETKQFYRVKSSLEESENGRFFCSLFTDFRDYVELYNDISDYSGHISDVSDFQASILSKMAEPYECCLPDLKDFCRSEEAVLYISSMDGGSIRRISYREEYERTRLPVSARMDRTLQAGRFDRIGAYHCLLSEKTEGRYYVVYVKGGEAFDEDHFRDISLYNVIRLYIENGILREKIIYESEHDHLTGLYNQGKFMSLLEEGRFHPDALAVFYFDINNLKVVNDHYGHEAGDLLIQRAARSILAVTSERVLAFRMGGDEFIMIGMDLTGQEAEELVQRWKEALAKINGENQILCVIACGMAYSDGVYDTAKLMELADTRMYQDKRRLKGEA